MRPQRARVRKGRLNARTNSGLCERWDVSRRSSAKSIAREDQSAPHDGKIVWVSHACVARPTGVGRAPTACRMPIEGRDEWIAAVERLA